MSFFNTAVRSGRWIHFASIGNFLCHFLLFSLSDLHFTTAITFDLIQKLSERTTAQEKSEIHCGNGHIYQKNPKWTT